jgi:hypothetical protein
VLTPISSLLAANRSGASSYYTNADGTLTLFGPDTLRYGTAGVLQERTRTNLVLQSQTFGTTWSAFNSTVTANVVAAPDGTTTADKVAETAVAADAHGVRQTILGLAANSKYMMSCYVKAAERTDVGIWIFGGGANGTQGKSFDLLTGTVNSITGSDPGTANGFIEPLADGWFRVGHQLLTDSDGGDIVIHIGPGDGTETDAYNGVAGSGVYLWGAQFEPAETNFASNASSYIPTTTTALTRASDRIDFLDLSWFDPIQGTFYADFTFLSTVAAEAQDDRIWGCEGGLTPMALQSLTTIVNFAGTPSAGGPTCTIGFSGTVNSPVRCASTLGPDGSAIVANGGTPATAAGPFTGWGFSLPNVGSGNGSVCKGSKYIRRMAFWNTVTPLAALATIGAPDWVQLLEGHYADYDFDFVQNRASVNGTISSVSSIITCTRATPALTYAEDTVGHLIPFAANTARLTNKGLLSERPATNLGRRSQRFADVAEWGFFSSETIVDNYTTAPDQTQTAAVYIPTDGVFAEFEGHQGFIFTNALYVQSIYAKYAGKPYIYLQAYDGTDDHRTYFNIQNGTLGSSLNSTNATITPMADGWYRCSRTFTPAVASGYIAWGAADTNGNRSALGNGVDGIYIWGHQFELAADVTTISPTSYIPTETVAVARDPDGARFVGSSRAYTASWFADGTPGFKVDGLNGRLLSSGTSFLYCDNTISIVGIFPPNLTTSLGVTGGAVKAAVGFTPGARSIVGNNGTVATDALSNTSDLTLNIDFGQSGGSNDNMNGYLRRVSGFLNFKAADAPLKALTV